MTARVNCSARRFPPDRRNSSAACQRHANRPAFRLFGIERRGQSAGSARDSIWAIFSAGFSHSIRAASRRTSHDQKRRQGIIQATGKGECGREKRLMAASCLLGERIARPVDYRSAPRRAFDHLRTERHLPAATQ